MFVFTLTTYEHGHSEHPSLKKEESSGRLTTTKLNLSRSEEKIIKFGI